MNSLRVMLTVIFAIFFANPVCCCAMAAPDAPSSCCGSQQHQDDQPDHDCVCLTDAPRVVEENRDLPPPAAAPLEISPPAFHTPLPWHPAPRILSAVPETRETGPPPRSREATCRFQL